MPLGPGKYDDLCTYVRSQAHAAGVLVIILGGDKGDGFSAHLEPQIYSQMPAFLRDTADQIEATFRRGQI